MQKYSQNGSNSIHFNDTLRDVLVRILYHSPEHCFLYHLTRSLYLVNISMTGVYSGIQWNIDVKPFDIPPPPASVTSAPRLQG